LKELFHGEDEWLDIQREAGVDVGWNSVDRFFVDFFTTITKSMSEKGV